MAAREARVLTEDDEAENDRADRAAPAAGGNGAAAAGDDFVMVEADDNLQPLTTEQPQEREEREEEDRLTEAEGGTRPLIEAEQDGDRPSRPKRERNAARRQAAARKDAEIAALAAQNVELQNQLQQLGTTVNGRFQQLDKHQRDQAIYTVGQQIEEQTQIAAKARRDMAQAMADGDQEKLFVALDARDKAIMTGQQLVVRKNLLETGNPTGERQNGGGRGDGRAAGEDDQRRTVQPPPARRVSPEENRYVKVFQAQHPWINTQEGASDGRVALALDQQVSDDGFTPDTQDYWDELEDRMRRVMPHRFDDADERPARQQERQRDEGRRAAPRQQATQPQRRGPAVGGGSERPVGVPKNGVLVNADRKNAMIEAGILASDGKTIQNREKYNRVMRSYQQFDSANAPSGGVRQ